MVNPAILIDMNGVLVDDEDLHEAALAKTAAAHGMSLGSKDYFTYFAGRTDRDGFVEFLNAKYPRYRNQLDELLEEKAADYQALASDGLVTYAGAPEFVIALQGRGHPLALVTGSTRQEADAVLNFLALNAAFDAVVSADDVTRGKPDPESFLLAASRLGLEPTQCVVVEDAPSGVQAAHAAGMGCAVVTTTHSVSELADADLVVGSVAQLTSEALSRLA